MDEELLAKQPPQSLEAEQAVLGSILIDSRPEDFLITVPDIGSAGKMMGCAVKLTRSCTPASVRQRIIQIKVLQRKTVLGNNNGSISKTHHAQTVFRKKKPVAKLKLEQGII